MTRRRVQVFIGGVIILGGIATLIIYSFNQSLVYDHSVAEFLSDPGLQRAHCRIYGKVQADTIVRASGGIGVTFSVTDGIRSVPVVYAREVPDTFKENGDVVVEGRIGGDGVFRANNLLAKCPSKYESEGVRQDDAAVTPASAPAGS